MNSRVENQFDARHKLELEASRARHSEPGPGHLAGTGGEESAFGLPQNRTIKMK
ncbi:MAG: hypothetical protein KGL75_02390 [Acidobacteriota bacterium]|nr:hypothetical protein [Acidobacteriota bacterium]